MPVAHRIVSSGSNSWPLRIKRTVAPRHDALLVAQDDVAAVRSSRNKERQKLAVVAFDMRAPAVARFYRLIVERLRDGGAGVMQQTSRRGG